MAVTLDTSASSTSNSFSYTMGSGTNGVLIAIGVGLANDTSVTYNGVNMTNLGTYAGSGSEPYTSIWVMYAPPSGAHTLAANANGILAASYFGVSVVTLQQQQGAAGASGAPSVTFNVGSALNANSWYGIGGGAGASVSAGTGTTERQSNTSSWAGFIGDSNGAVGSGAFSMAASWGDTQGFNFVLYEIEPQTNNTVTPAYGSLALTGESVNLLHGTFHSITAAVGTFTLTGIALAFTLFRLWVNQSKHSTSFSNSTKHTAPTFTNQTKHSTTFTNQTKDV